MNVREEASTIQMRFVFKLRNGKSLYASVNGRKLLYWIVDSKGCRILQPGEQIQ